MTGRQARRAQVRADVRTARRVRKYAAVKGTSKWEKQQDRLREEAVEEIVSLGYTRERAIRAVREYAAAARDTQLGPDWRGWLDMVAAAGLAEQ